MGTNWQSVAYNNAYNAAKSGQPLSHAISNQPDYESATRAAYSAYSASKPKSSSSSSSSSKSSPTVTTIAPTVAKTAATTSTPKVETPAPTLTLPTLNLGKDSSVVNQTEKLLRSDSLAMQQAKAQAQENGTASGQIHSAQQEVASMRAMSDVAATLGEKEATVAMGEDISNWNQQATQATETYQNEYAERLAKMGYDSNERQLMASLNTSLSQSMLSSATTLMNNVDIEYLQGTADKQLAIINAAQENNNLALDMGFSY